MWETFGVAGPIHPRLLKRAKATRWFMIATVLVGIVTAVLLIAQAGLIATWVTTAFASKSATEGVR